MLKLYSDNAVMAKAKSLYGQRLTEEDYRQLLSKKAVGEVAAYLKRETYYASAFAEVKEELIHRGQLENLVRKHMLDTYVRLMRYTRQDDVFTQLYVSENEVIQLLHIIRMLNANSMAQYIVSFPAYLSGHLSFDLFSAAKIKSYDELLSLVAHSPYYNILGRFRPISSERSVDITGVETALLTHHYDSALARVQKHYRGGARRDLSDLLFMDIDLHNLKVIYRMKRFFGSDPQQIDKCLLHVQSHINPHTYHDLLEAGDASAVLRRLEKVHMIHPYLNDPSHNFEHMIFTLAKERSRRFFRFSVKPPVVVMCFMSLLRVEVGNIIHITEGIRYGASADEIRKLLV